MLDTRLYLVGISSFALPDSFPEQACWVQRIDEPFWLCICACLPNHFRLHAFTFVSKWSCIVDEYKRSSLREWRHLFAVCIWHTLLTSHNAASLMEMVPWFSCLHCRSSQTHPDYPPCCQVPVGVGRPTGLRRPSIFALSVWLPNCPISPCAFPNLYRLSNLWFQLLFLVFIIIIHH